MEEIEETKIGETKIEETVEKIHSPKYASVGQTLATIADDISLLGETYSTLIDNSRTRSRMLLKILSHFVEEVDYIDDRLHDLFNNTDMSEDEIAQTIASELVRK